MYDAATQTVYLTAKVNDGPDTSHPSWYVHALDASTGAERSGWPVKVQGAPVNDPSHPFNAFTAAQRPGLLLMDGTVYAGFASHCDIGPYVGYVLGVNTTTRKTTLWAAEDSAANGMAGIWMSGGGLVSDGPGRIFFTTGNGVSPAPGPGSNPPGQLAESVVRLGVNSDGTMSAQDFFSPSNAPILDQNDTDLGSEARRRCPVRCSGRARTPTSSCRSAKTAGSSSSTGTTSVAAARAPVEATGCSPPSARTRASGGTRPRTAPRAAMCTRSAAKGRCGRSRTESTVRASPR
ncbi:hypothetical protein ACFQ0Q_40950 [Streptomyces aureus]